MNYIPMRRARWAGLLLIGILGGVVGCGGGGAPQPALDEGEWEVTVISGDDTTQVQTEAPVEMTDPTAESETPATVGEWEVSVESPLTDPTTAGETKAGTEPSAKPLPPRSEPVSDEPASDPAPDPKPGAFVFGYRIQVFAAASMTVAEQEAARADSLFTFPVYVEYEPPYYKVRLGDFLMKEDAMRVKLDTVGEVYDKAWIVETMVRRPR